VAWEKQPPQEEDLVDVGGAAEVDSERVGAALGEAPAVAPGVPLAGEVDPAEAGEDSELGEVASAEAGSAAGEAVAVELAAGRVIALR
jgi:hypothetical protein